MYNGIDVLMGAEDAAVNNPEAKVGFILFW